MYHPDQEIGLLSSQTQPSRRLSPLGLLLLFALPALAVISMVQTLLETRGGPDPEVWQVAAPFTTAADNTTLNARLLAAVCTLGLLLLAWLLDGLVLRKLLRRDLAGGLAFSALTALPLLLLPLLQLAPLVGLADQLRLGKTSPTSLGFGVAAAIFLIVRALALLIRSPVLKATAKGDDSHGSQAALGMLVLHALLLGGFSLVGWTDDGSASAGAAGLSSLIIIGLALALPLASLGVLRLLVPGARISLVEALSWVPSILAGLLGAGALALGWANSWDATLHLLLAAAGSLLFKLFYLQVNAPVARAVNWASLACCALILASLEGAARQSYLDIAWAGKPTGRFVASEFTGWVEARKEFDYIEKVRRWKKYPESMFPVKFSARGGSKATRVVFLGGSSTGGAYQMDNLDVFFPAEVQRRLDRAVGQGKFEVINQGVGGWNTLHIRLYLRQYIKALDPDLLVFYVGHNDIGPGRGGDRTYREMWQHYKSQGRKTKRVLDFLRGSRLFVGFQCLLGARRASLLRESDKKQSVPPEHARENLEEIFKLARAQGARVLLLSEAINGRPSEYSFYRYMLEDVARAQGGRYLDTHEAMTTGDYGKYFLDRCHLTVAGHIRLAELILEAVKARQ